MSTTSRLTLLVAAAALVPAACGGSDAAVPATSAPATTAAPTTTAPATTVAPTTVAPATTEVAVDDDTVELADWRLTMEVLDEERWDELADEMSSIYLIGPIHDEDNAILELTSQLLPVDAIALDGDSVADGPPRKIGFTAANSIDPEGSELTFAWDLDGDGDYSDAVGDSASAAYTVADAQPRRIEVGLRVTDSAGASDFTHLSATVLRDSLFAGGFEIP